MNFMGDEIARNLHEVVLNGELGYDYTFDSKRDKNYLFRRKFYIDDAKMIDILLELNGSNYFKSAPSNNNNHKSDTVHFFKINKELMPRYDENSNYVNVCIYIKVTWPDSGEPMFIMSFHEDMSI